MKGHFNERGQTLVLVLIVFIIFSILGLLLGQSVINGSHHTQKREEDVQATYLAKKGADYFYTDFSSKIKMLENIDEKDYEATVDQFLDAYDAKKGHQKTMIGKNGNRYTVQVTDRKRIHPEDPEDLTEEITVLSKGVAGSKEKALKNVYRLGAKKVPDALKYAIGAYNDKCTNPNTQNCGNVYLHGPVSIVGDAFVGGNLITSSNSTYVYGNRHWQKADWPTAEPLPGHSYSSISLGGSIYTMDTPPPDNDRFYTSHVSNNNFKNPNNQYKYHDYGHQADQAFKTNYAPKIENYPPNFTPIDIDAQQEIFEKNNYDPPDYFKNYYLNKSLNTGDGMLVNGNLTISGRYYNPLLIQGPMFVTGNLTIDQANARFDSVIYVKGDVTIEDSTIKQLDQGSLIIFSKGNIYLRNNNMKVRLDEKPNDDYTMRMFLYSEQDLEIYGVRSYINIDGGIFAKRIILNAANGNTETHGESIHFDKRENLPPEYSRLRIKYNEDLVQNPSKGLPKVKGLDLTLVDRSK